MKILSPDSSPAPTWQALELTGPPLPVNHEFTPKTQSEIFASVGLPLGLYRGSKSGYRRSHQKHFFMANANVFCHPYGKIWWGDLDLWRDAAALERAARRLHCRLYVLWEHDGRFDNADLKFQEVRNRALWHTGGPARPDGQLVRRSGLNLIQLALFVGVSARRLATKQLPYIAQQINRRIVEVEAIFAPSARHYGFKKWGRWFLAPHPKLNHRSPLEVLRAGETLVFIDLFPEIHANDELLEKFHSSLFAGYRIPLGGGISFAWPIRERRR
jgi:hypothetical protein